MYTASKFEFEVNTTEYVYTVSEVSAYRPNTIRAYFPKLMAKIPRGTPSSNRTSINKNMFCNDTSCKPNPSTLISTQNFITIQHYPNEQPTFSNYANSRGMLPKGTKIQVDIPSGDIRNIKFTQRIG